MLEPRNHPVFHGALLLGTVQQKVHAARFLVNLTINKRNHDTVATEGGCFSVYGVRLIDGWLTATILCLRSYPDFYGALKEW